MKSVLSVLWDFRFIIMVILGIALFAIFQWQQFKVEAYKLMLQAKRLAKDAVLKSGDEQVEWILKRAYQFLPRSFMIFISEERLRIILKYLYSKLKDYIDDGELNSSTK